MMKGQSLNSILFGMVIGMHVLLAMEVVGMLMMNVGCHLHLVKHGRHALPLVGRKMVVHVLWRNSIHPTEAWLGPDGGASNVLLANDSKTLQHIGNVIHTTNLCLHCLLCRSVHLFLVLGETSELLVDGNQRSILLLLRQGSQHSLGSIRETELHISRDEEVLNQLLTSRSHSLDLLVIIVRLVTSLPGSLLGESLLLNASKELRQVLASVPTVSVLLHTRHDIESLHNVDDIVDPPTLDIQVGRELANLNDGTIVLTFSAGRSITVELHKALTQDGQGLILTRHG
mmetsp:Transcript_18274/g.39467  ORF Transcript_18274/g.39467 Transcript_18274/m.39467 type:complete len:286 (-) Transcript_18274:787-1644(-)